MAEKKLYPTSSSANLCSSCTETFVDFLQNLEEAFY